jgi:hypothetical protein
MDTAQTAGTSNAEDSRPRRQFKEDLQLKKKPAGRKRTKEQTEAKYVNWFLPALWSQIAHAAVCAGKPWSPREIVKQAQRKNSESFSRLTEQVVGRWIDQEAKKCGVSCWKESVLERVRKGSAPGGNSTRIGILVRHHRYHVLSLIFDSFIVTRVHIPRCKNQLNSNSKLCEKLVSPSPYSQFVR